MKLNLEGRTALVTGASSGLGTAIARFLAGEGVRVGVHGRNAERTQAVAADIHAGGSEAHALIADLVDPQQIARLADEALAALGQVDILVCNAGGRATLAPIGWEESTPENWRVTFDMNVGYSVELIRRLAPAMRDRGHGRIILISSAAGHQPMGNQPDYGAAKAALVNLAISTSKWLRECGVTVNAISPGATMSPALERYLQQVAQKKGWGDDWAEIERRAASEMMKIPAGRVARAEEVAATVAYLASPWAASITGANIHIDGGVIGAMT